MNGSGAIVSNFPTNIQRRRLNDVVRLDTRQNFLNWLCSSTLDRRQSRRLYIPPLQHFVMFRVRVAFNSLDANNVHYPIASDTFKIYTYNCMRYIKWMNIRFDKSRAQCKLRALTLEQLSDVRVHSKIWAFGVWQEWYEAFGRLPDSDFMNWKNHRPYSALTS